MLKADGEEIGSIGRPLQIIGAASNEPVPVPKIEYLIANLLGDDASAMSWLKDGINCLRREKGPCRFFSTLEAALATRKTGREFESYTRIILIVNDKPFWVVWRAS